MIAIDRSSVFWQYLSDGQRGLIEEGLYLLEDMGKHPDAKVTDYSYLVFPFAKAYEGFLKKLFLDLGFISAHEYESDHFRIGKALNPHMSRILGKHSVYQRIVHYCQGEDVARELWDVWKAGRNQVFHYFPHNLKALTYEEAYEIIQKMIAVMRRSIASCRVK